MAKRVIEFPVPLALRKIFLERGSGELRCGHGFSFQLLASAANLGRTQNGHCSVSHGLDKSLSAALINLRSFHKSLSTESIFFLFVFRKHNNGLTSLQKNPLLGSASCLCALKSPRSTDSPAYGESSNFFGRPNGYARRLRLASNRSGRERVKQRHLFCHRPCALLS